MARSATRKSSPSSASDVPHTPETAQEALDRDIDLAAEHAESVRVLFRRERDRLAANPEKDPVRDAEWAALIAALWVTAGEEVYKSTVTAISPGVTPGPTPEFPSFIGDAAKGIARTTRRRIEALRRTKPRNLSRQLRKLYQLEFVKKRAPRIALDQALRQTASFEDAAAKKVEEATGVPLEKVWHNQGDSRVRSSHLSVAAVLLDQPFLVGGAELRYPRDPAGAGRETFGCRCWAEHREATEETILAAEDTQADLRKLDKQRLDAALKNPDRIAEGIDANPEVNRLADQLFEEALRDEKRLSKVTGGIRQRTGAEFQHFGERVKYRASLRSKIFREVKENPGISFKQAAAKIGDKNRYTMMWENNANYRRNHAAAVDAFNRDGWKTINDTNTWIGRDTYDGMNYKFQKGGTIVEVQFHTPASAAIKDVSAPLYTTWRDLPDGTQKNKAYQEILDLWSDPKRAHVPPGMDDVGTPTLFL